MLKELLETAQGLHAHGVMSKLDMAHVQALCAMRSISSRGLSTGPPGHLSDCGGLAASFAAAVDQISAAPFDECVKVGT